MVVDAETWIEVQRREEPQRNRDAIDPESQAETPGDGTLVRHGLWCAACRLSECHREFLRFRHALRAHGLANEDSDPWFVRNILSRSDIESIFVRAVRAKYLEWMGASAEAGDGEPTDVREMLRHGLRKALGDEGLEVVLKKGWQSAFDLLDSYGHEIFSGCRDLSLGDVLDRVSEKLPSGVDGPSVFFNTLSRGAVLLWNLPPHEANGESAYLLYSDPWGAELAHRGQEIIGQCETGREHFSTEVALIRVSRGKHWVSSAPA
jgi:hypothetical protein